MCELSEAVGAPEDMKIWPSGQFCFLDMYHDEKLYEAAMRGRHRQPMIALRKYSRASGKKSLQKLAEVIADTFSYTMASGECKKMEDLITATRLTSTAESH